MINQEHLNDSADVISMGKIATYREVANTVVWLCSDLSSLVTGHTLPLEGQFFTKP